MTSKTAVIAANRFGLGAKPGELPSIAADPRTWLREQILKKTATPSELQRLPDTPTVLIAVQEARSQDRENRDSNSDTQRKQYGPLVRSHYLQQLGARYQTAANSELPFRERLVHFWSNHFAVSADKQPLSALAGLYENEAIRPHVAGNFVDMLLAAEKHPAMLLYLDNQRSAGPNTQLARRANKRRSQNVGLNENLAREILELHTMGVNGGYTQRDVTTFAKAITGWSIGGETAGGRFSEGMPGTFEFRERIHEPGKQTILGKTYAEAGVAQGEAILRDLALHHSTARHLAFKLARHFVADNPPTELVRRIADSYLATGGDLAAMYSTLINADAAWRLTRAKFKTPHDFVISTMRATGRTLDNDRMLFAALELLGQAPFRPGSPAGWPDTAIEWSGADALFKRIDWSNAVADRIGSALRPQEIASAILGETLDEHTATAIGRAESAAQGLTLLLASPDFQRR